MTVLAASGFGIYQLSQLPPSAPVWQQLDYQIWQQIGFHFHHPEWVSNFALPDGASWGLEIGVSFWDLIQPAFMFIVGVAMPFSYARRAAEGHSAWRRFGHAAWRAVVLVLLGVFLSSNWVAHTNWTFVNVLSQIGLAYLFVYALLGRRFWIQLLALVVILVGYWGLFYSYSPPEDYNYQQVNASEESVFAGQFAPWSKNANIGHVVDRWLLNQFPRPEEFKYNRGGYVTLNFVPSIATMLLGVFCGQLLRSGTRWWWKLLLLVAGGAACMALALLADHYVCPIVKRIWTPSWVLFSGAWVVWALAVFYLVFDLCRLGWLAFPLVVVGMNSLAMYLMGQLIRPWAEETMQKHFAGAAESLFGSQVLADNMYGHVIGPTSAFILFWLIAFWMYRQKYFVRI
jgi:predicted acyltransferase